MIQQRQDALASQGLVSILVIEDASNGPATAALCAQLRTKYQLTIPVLYDPTGALQRHFAFKGPNELNVVLDHGGVVAWLGRYSDQASAVTPAIQAALAE